MTVTKVTQTHKVLHFEIEFTAIFAHEKSQPHQEAGFWFQIPSLTLGMTDPYGNGEQET